MSPVDTIVEPDGLGGCNGPPIPVGVAQVSRIRDNAPTITRTFDPPRADLLDADWDSMSDDEKRNC
jgi:hypothetical protein